MEIAVLVEQVDGHGYRATTLSPPGLVAEGPTRDEAITRLRELVSGRLAKGEVIRIEVPEPKQPHPWKRLIGCLKGHPDLAAVEQNIREYRRQVDEDPNR